MADNYWKKRKGQCGDMEKLDLIPLAIPVGYQRPETTNEAIARILYSSGQLSLDAYQAMRGMEFDMDYDADEDFDFEEYDDDIIQSSFAKYEDDPLPPTPNATQSGTDSNTASVGTTATNDSPPPKTESENETALDDSIK